MKRKRDERRTYTKKAVKSLLIVGVLNAEIPYLLAYLGYLCKAYFETKQAEQVRLQEKKMTEEAKG